MFCEECGTKNENDTKFCTNCGHQMKGKSKSVEVSTSSSERKVDLNAVVDNVTVKGKNLIAKGKDYYTKKPKVVYGICGVIVLLVIVLFVFGNKTMICEADDDSTVKTYEVKYNGDDEITKIVQKEVAEIDNDFEDELEYLGYDDIDEYIEEKIKEFEEVLEDEDAPEGLTYDIKQNGDELISTRTFESEALEEYLDDMDIKDIDDMEDYLEDGYSDFKCEK